MRKLGRLVALLGLSVGQAGEAADSAWPDLPTRGFIAGRAATLDDAQKGDAAFSLNGQSLGALPIAIPQYATWKDEHGTNHRMIVVQAERAPDGSEIVGLRDFEGGETVATLAEVTLLGTKKPH